MNRVAFPALSDELALQIVQTLLQTDAAAVFALGCTSKTHASDLARWRATLNWTHVGVCGLVSAAKLDRVLLAGRGRVTEITARFDGAECPWSIGCLPAFARFMEAFAWRCAVPFSAVETGKPFFLTAAVAAPVTKVHLVSAAPPLADAHAHRGRPPVAENKVVATLFCFRSFEKTLPNLECVTVNVAPPANGRYDEDETATRNDPRFIVTV